jgi:hypothetical protein
MSIINIVRTRLEFASRPARPHSVKVLAIECRACLQMVKPRDWSPEAAACKTCTARRDARIAAEQARLAEWQKSRLPRGGAR